MKLTVTGSSSAGNGYVLQNDAEALLLEAGVPFAETQKALRWNVSKVQGCLVTHEHKDHAGYVADYLKSGISVYASAGTIDQITPRIRTNRAPVACEAGKVIQLGGFKVLPFATAHDAAQPLGFLINHDDTGNVLFATDTYLLPFRFSKLSNIMIECNYQDDLLDQARESNRIPDAVLRRTVTSHMSLANCIATLRANDLRRVSRIVLIHLSSANSNEVQCREAVASATHQDVIVAEPGLEIDLNKLPF